MKRIISFILALSIIFSLNIYVGAEESATKGIEGDFLVKVGVLNEGFDLTKEVTRGEFARYIINVLYGKDEFLSAGVTYFTDVPLTNANCGAITACKDLGIINGDGSGNFYPDRTITATESITMLINALGYKLYADSKGGFEAGYLAIAKEAELFKNVEVRGMDKVKGEDAALFIYNALFADLVSVKSVSTDGFTLEKLPDKNILTEKLSIYEYDGVVTDDGITSISGNSVSDIERTVITLYNSEEKVTAYVGETDINSHLGERVRAFVRFNKDSGKNEVIYYGISKKMESVTLISEKVIGATSSYIEYEDDNNSEPVKYSISGIAPIVVVNGIKKISYDESEFIRKNSLLKLIDVDNDGSYETIIILDFNKNGVTRNIVVDSVDLVNEYIKCRFSPVNTLDYDSDKNIIRFSWESDVKSVEEIQQNDIVSIAMSNGTYRDKNIYTLSVKRNQNVGKMTAYSSNGVYINDMELKVSDSIYSVKPNYIELIAIGSEITYMLDATGKIAYIVNPNVSKVPYAYLIGASIKTDADEYVMVKLFNNEAEFVTTRLAPKTTIDGIECSTPKKQMEALKKRDGSSKKLDQDKEIARPVIVKYNKNNEVNYIDTDCPNDNIRDNDYYYDQSPISYSKADTDDVNTLKAGYRNVLIDSYTPASGNVGNRFYITSDTQIIRVPDIDTYGLLDAGKYTGITQYFDNENWQTNNWLVSAYSVDYDMIKLREKDKTETNYQVLLPNHMPSSYRYDMQAYNVDYRTGVAGLVVVRGTSNIYNYYFPSSNPAYIYLRMTEVYDEARDSKAYKMYYTLDGTKEEYTLFIEDDLTYEQHLMIFGSKEKDNIYALDVDKLNKGDIIRIGKKGDWLDYFERVVKIEKLSETRTNMRFPLAPQYPYTKRLHQQRIPGDASMESEDSGSPMTLAYARNVSGDKIGIYVSRSYSKSTLGYIDVGNPDTYLKMFYTVAANTRIVNMDYTSGELKVYPGTLSDIVTYEATNNLKKTSKLFMSPNSIIIINGK